MSVEMRGAAVAFAVAAAVTLLMAAPVIVAPSDRLFGDAGTFAREDPNRDPLVVIEQMRTGHVPAPYLQPLTDLPGRALARIIGPVAAYNAVVLMTFPLSAAAAYLLARHFIPTHAGSLVAALAFSFLPFHLAHAAHHPHVAQTQWIPLYFLALWRCADRPDARRVLLLLAATAAAGLSNFYGGLIVIVLGPVALAAYAIGGPRDGGWRRLAMPALVVVATPVAALVVLRLFVPSSSALALPRSDLFLHAARWWSYLVPAVDHPLAGSRVRHFWTGTGVEGALLEQQVYVGWSLLVLATVPLWRRLRGDRSGPVARMAPVLAIVAAAALLCSLSPERRLGAFTFVRPSALLYGVAPMFRAYARFGAVTGLMIAVLAGGGAALLLAGRTAWSRRAAAALLVLAAVDLAPFPPWRWRDVLPTQAHRWMATQRDDARVLDCVSGARASDRLAAPLVGHPVSFLDTPGFDDCGEPHLADKLRARGYTHAILRRSGTDRASLLGQDGFAAGPEFDDSTLLRVNEAPPAPYVERLVGFFPRESAAARSWRWMGRRGALVVMATGSGDMALEIDLAAFPRARRVEWLVNGHSTGAVDVAREWRTFTLPLGTIERGRSTILLACAEPAVIAAGVLHNDDARPLALAIGTWRLVPAAPRPGLY